MRKLSSQDGALMIEVLITIVIIVIGLVGLMQMQSQLQKSEVESYQRTQALMLAKDMASRISANRANATSYKTADAITEPDSLSGTDCTSTTTLADRDRKEWCEAILGAAEVQSGSNVGALINGRGCIYEVLPGVEYLVTVVWQGLSPIGTAGPVVACGKDSPNPYDSGAECVGDLCRRAVSTTLRIGSLPP